MKHLIYIKLLILGSFLSMFFYGCFNSNELTINKLVNSIKHTNNELLFKKNSSLEWRAKSIKVSFEDNLKNFFLIDDFRQELTTNNINQGIVVKIKLIDHNKNIEKVSEIMIESHNLSNGLNEFLIGYQDNTPYIIY
ncbi:hypothetical protein [Flavobacterium sp.]|uniref:hypothetical protein n=1 Tax=Flavobacterium sp. TaxID=239 RepID=UPI0026024F01|nr:hypothetical protein [Flavobacterium sp.]MDD3004303.1 hypothetical protein [Flavobacterium sp.]